MNNRLTLLLILVSNCHVSISWCMEKGKRKSEQFLPNKKKQSKKTKPTTLFAAIKEGNIEVVKDLLQAGDDITKKENDCTSLFSAMTAISTIESDDIQTKRKQIIELLLQHKDGNLLINAKSKNQINISNKETCLHFITRKIIWHPEFDDSIDTYIPPELKENPNQLVYHKNSKKLFSDIMNLLLEHGENPYLFHWKKTITTLDLLYNEDHNELADHMISKYNAFHKGRIDHLARLLSGGNLHQKRDSSEGYGPFLIDIARVIAQLYYQWKPRAEQHS